jgi:hypothetical protein
MSRFRPSFDFRKDINITEKVYVDIHKNVYSNVYVKGNLAHSEAKADFGVTYTETKATPFSSEALSTGASHIFHSTAYASAYGHNSLAETLTYNSPFESYSGSTSAVY